MCERRLQDLWIVDEKKFYSRVLENFEPKGSLGFVLVDRETD